MSCILVQSILDAGIRSLLPHICDLGLYERSTIPMGFCRSFKLYADDIADQCESLHDFQASVWIAYDQCQIWGMELQ